MQLLANHLLKEGLGKVGVQPRMRGSPLASRGQKTSQQGVDSALLQQSERSKEGLSQLQWALGPRLVASVQSIEEGKDLAVTESERCRRKHIRYRRVRVGVVTMVISKSL